MYNMAIMTLLTLCLGEEAAQDRLAQASQLDRGTPATACFSWGAIGAGSGWGSRTSARSTGPSPSLTAQLVDGMSAGGPPPR
jgi:hypothetical protein